MFLDGPVQQDSGADHLDHSQVLDSDSYFIGIGGCVYGGSEIGERVWQCMWPCIIRRV